MEIFKYVLAENELQIKLGRWTVRRLPYSDMLSAESGYNMMNEHWTNPFGFDFITIRRKTGLIRNFVINPRPREAFLSQLNARINK